METAFAISVVMFALLPLLHRLDSKQQQPVQEATVEHDNNVDGIGIATETA